MRNLGRKLTLLGAALLLAAAPARADNVRLWNVCGGTSTAFKTCAMVQVTVTGTNVELRVRNLAGTGDASNAASWVITNVGLDYLPSTVSALAVPAATTSGPTRAGDTPTAWKIYNDLSNGGGVNVDIGAQNGVGVKNGLASDCATTGTLPGGSNQLYMTVNGGCAGVGAYSVANASLNGGWLTISFSVNQTFDLAGVTMFYKAQNGPNGLSTECITGTGKNANCFDVPPDVPPDVTVTPEPATMTLLATGLAGIIGGARRRRRKQG